jgi:hypothetical protein
MAALRRAVTTVAVRDMAPHRHAVGRHRAPEEPRLAGRPRLATVAVGDQRPLRLGLPLVGARPLEAGSIHVEAGQRQGIPLAGLADHGPVETRQARGPPRVQRPAQAMILAVGCLQRALAAHGPLIAGQRVGHAGQGVLAGETGSDPGCDAFAHRHCRALVGQDQGLEPVLHPELSPQRAHQREVIQACEIDHLRG